jgi:hypothetical protein
MARGRIVALASAAIALAACGCASGDSCSTECAAGNLIDVAIAGPGGTLPPVYQVVIDWGTEVVDAVCGGGAELPDGVTCTGSGLTAEGPLVRDATVTVKAAGARTVLAAPVTWTDVPVCCSDGVARARGLAEVALHTVPAFEATADYRTGFDAVDGPDDFAAMAFTQVDDLGASRVVKFYIDGLDEEAVVYFQDTKKHPIHYDFANQVLGKAVSQDEFEERTYRNEKRDAVAGSVIMRPDLAIAAGGGKTWTSPLTIEFFPSDHLAPSHAAFAYLRIQERLAFAPLAGGSGRLFYLPAGDLQEQQASVSAHALASSGVLWLRRAEVFGGLTAQYLNPGVAYGTLRVLSPEQLEGGVVSFHDIAVLTRLPNELPLVGGTITEELQTPLAHVNVAARARGTPNMALVHASADPRVAPLVGKLVRLEVKPGAFTLAEVTLEEAEAFWEDQSGKPKLTPAADVARDGLLAFEDIGFMDAIAVGPKAANVAELSHPDVLGALAPRGFAVPFHHYDSFLDYGVVTGAACDAAEVACKEHGGTVGDCGEARGLCAPSGDAGETVRQWTARVLADPAVAADSALRWAATDVLRSLFCLLPVEASFAKELDDRVADLFKDDKVRLRSSSNAEDLPSFSGAGLYTSVSANRPGEPASARICLVWASTWNWKAVEERSFWNVDHASVRMAVAVETSYPDEAANGVLITRNLATPSLNGMYVNVQLGEVSVTNPTDGALPEVFAIIAAPEGIQVARERYSSLSPGVPILSDAEILGLAGAAYKVQTHFAPLYCKERGCDPERFPLDLEFKLHGPERALVVKQVRPYFSASSPH